MNQIESGHPLPDQILWQFFLYEYSPTPLCQGLVAAKSSLQVISMVTHNHLEVSLSSQSTFAQQSELIFLVLL